MRATYEEGTELVIDSETIAHGTGWSDVAGLSDVFRLGSMVTVAIRATFSVAIAGAEAWKKQKYKKGECATEGGHTYEAIVAETDELKPTVKTADWADLGLTALLGVVCTLPVEYRPSADLFLTGHKIEDDGKVVSEALAAVSVEATYRAATATP